MTTKSTSIMDELMNGATDVAVLNTGDMIEATVLTVKKHEAWLDLGPRGLGLVMRREIGHSTQLEKGQTVTACVLEPELEEGYALLSLRKAAKDKGWETIEKIVEAKEIIEVNAYDANRGGLLIEYEGVRGFLPVSQLSAEHYPRVSGADKDEILQKLHALVKETIKVRILDADRKENKLIFSEKEAIRDDMASRFSELKVGDEVEGTVTGVVDFGAFLNVSGIEGLIHISEISWDRVEDPNQYVKVGERVKAKIIAIDKDRLSLSLKQMQEDPWVKEIQNYKSGDNVTGSVTRITPFGAFVQISPSIEALVHVSELGDADSQDPQQVFKLKEEKTFTILDIDESNRKISLRLKG